MNSQANRARERESKAVDAGRLSLAMALPFTVAGFFGSTRKTKQAGRKTLDKTVVGSFVGSFVSVAPLFLSLSLSLT